jgi:hypothetical protein
MKKNEMIEDLEYLGAFSPGEVKPGFMTADVTHKERTTDLLFISSLVRREKKEQPTQFCSRGTRSVWCKQTERRGSWCSTKAIERHSSVISVTRSADERHPACSRGTRTRSSLSLEHNGIQCGRSMKSHLSTGKPERLIGVDFTGSFPFTAETLLSGWQRGYDPASLQRSARCAPTG